MSIYNLPEETAHALNKRAIDTFVHVKVWFDPQHTVPGRGFFGPDQDYIIPFEHLPAFVTAMEELHKTGKRWDGGAVGKLQRITASYLTATDSYWWTTPGQARGKEATAEGAVLMGNADWDIWPKVVPGEHGGAFHQYNRFFDLNPNKPAKQAVNS